MLLVVCQLSRDAIGCEDCKTWLLRFDPSYASQMSVGLSILLVKLVVCKVQVAVGNDLVVTVVHNDSHSEVE